jgi:hypothetical protein
MAREVVTVEITMLDVVRDETRARLNPTRCFLLLGAYQSRIEV